MARLGPAQAERARASANPNPPSPRSAEWLRDILLNRVLPAKDGVSGEERARIALGMLDSDAMTQREVSKAIDAYRNCPRRAIAQDRANAGPSIVVPGAEKIPKGYYAIPHEDDYRFYRIWRGTRNPNYVEIWVQHGPEETKLPWNVATYANLLGRILDYGPYESAVLYGRKIGRCSQCHLRLTNQLSRHLAIGPICGGRFWDSPAEWRQRKAVARAELRAMGIDPEGSVE